MGIKLYKLIIEIILNTKNGEYSLEINYLGLVLNDEKQHINLKYPTTLP